MIQRVQSVYLLLMIIIMSFLLIRPFAQVTDSEGQKYIFHAQAVKQMAEGEEVIFKETLPVFIEVTIAGILGFITMFLYSRRIVQLRLIVINISLILLLVATMLYYYFSVQKPLDIIQHAFRIPAIYPIMAIFLNFMAYKAINRDEALVNSYKRMR